MLPELTDYLLENWAQCFPATERPETLRYFGIPGSVEGGTTTFLGFSHGRGSKPLFAVKVHRDQGVREEVIRERDVLALLQTSAGPLVASIPKVILCRQIGGAWILVQTILNGRPMSARLTASGQPDLEEATGNFALAMQWVSEMHRATRMATPSAVDDPSGLRDTIQGFTSTFNLSAGERQYLESLGKKISSFVRVGTCVRHGDFCRHNLLVEKKGTSAKLGVIDWTFSELAALPLHDLLFFLATYFLQIRTRQGPEGFTRAFEYTFLDTNEYSGLVKRCILDYCQQMQIADSDLEPLFASFLMDQAMSEYRRVLRCAKRGGLPRFTVYLAGLNNDDYGEALKEQLWPRFFRLFVERRRDFFV